MKALVLLGIQCIRNIPEFINWSESSADDHLDNESKWFLSTLIVIQELLALSHADALCSCFDELPIYLLHLFFLRGGEKKIEKSTPIILFMRLSQNLL